MLSSGIPWFGGKNRQRKHIIPLIEQIPHRTYGELFAGGASVFFGKTPSPREVLNDLNGELVTFYRVLQRHTQALLDYLADLHIGRDEFYRLRDQDPKHLTDIQRAAAFFYTIHLGFGGKSNRQPFGGIRRSAPWSLISRSYRERLVAARERLAHAVIENLPWQDFVARADGDQTAFYVDPPYITAGEGYSTPFAEQDHRDLAAALHTIKGSFVLSLDDCPLARELYRRCRVRKLATLYTGRGIGRSKQVTELIILGPPGRSKPPRTPFKPPSKGAQTRPRTKR